MKFTLGIEVDTCKSMLGWSLGGKFPWWSFVDFTYKGSQWKEKTSYIIMTLVFNVFNKLIIKILHGKFTKKTRKNKFRCHLCRLAHWISQWKSPLHSAHIGNKLTNLLARFYEEITLTFPCRILHIITISGWLKLFLGCIKSASNSQKFYQLCIFIRYMFG